MINREVRRLENWTSDEIACLHIAFCGLLDELNLNTLQLNPLVKEAAPLRDQHFSSQLAVKLFELTGRANWADGPPIIPNPNHPQVGEHISVPAEIPDITKL